MQTTEDRLATAARRVASFALVPERDADVPDVPEPDWPRLLELLAIERLTGLAVAATASGWLHPPPASREELMARHRDAMVWALTVEGVLLEVDEAFARVGIQTVVLKGPALARSVYPVPEWRPFGDMDLLVRTADWRSACRILAGLGLRRRTPEPRPEFDERFGKAATFEATDGLHVDLHRTLAAGPFGLWIGADELHEGTVPLPVGGRVVRRLNDTTLLLHACVHASLGSRPPRLLALRDVLQVASSGWVDWEAAAARARRWRLGAVTRHALATAAATLGVTPPPESASLRVLPADRRERRALEVYTTDRRLRGGVALGTIGAIPGLANKARYVEALLLPSRRFLVARTGSERASAYLSRWATPLRWVGRGSSPGGRRRRY